MTAHTCRHICELPFWGQQRIYTLQEEQPSNLFFSTVNFADSQTELSFSAFFNVFMPPLNSLRSSQSCGLATGPAPTGDDAKIGKVCETAKLSAWKVWPFNISTELTWVRKCRSRRQQFSKKGENARTI
jgi:hypothetical protein